MIISENGNVSVGSGYANNSYLFNVAGTSNITGATTLNSTLNVLGASTLTSISATTLSTSGNTTLSGNLTVSGTPSLNSSTFINTVNGSTNVGLVINNNNPAGTGTSTTSLQLTQGNYGMQLSGALTQGVGASFNLSVGQKTTPSWSTIMSGDQSTLTIASNTTVAKQLNLSQSLNLTNSTTYESIKFLNYTNNANSCSILAGCSSSGNGNNISITGDNGIIWQGSYGFFIAPNQTGPSGTRWDANGNMTNASSCTMNNNVKYGTNSVILTTNTTLSFPLNRVIFVNALTFSITITLPTLTSANNGLVITIRALPTCTQTVYISFSSSQVIYLANTSSSATTYPMNGTSGALHLTAINNYWMQI
jgi:hypothetical protein